MYYTLADYTSTDLTTTKSFIAAMHYLNRKQAARDSLGAFKAVIGWTLGAAAMWVILFLMFYGF